MYFYIFIPTGCNLQCIYYIFIILCIKINGICFLTVPKSLFVSNKESKMKPV